MSISSSDAWYVPPGESLPWEQEEVTQVADDPEAQNAFDSMEQESGTSLPSAPATDAPETWDILKVALWGSEEGDKPTQDQLIKGFLEYLQFKEAAEDVEGKTALYFDPDDPAGPKLMEVGIAESGKEARTEDSRDGGILSFITGGAELSNTKGMLIIGLMLAAGFLGLLIVLKQ